MLFVAPLLSSTKHRQATPKINQLISRELLDVSHFSRTRVFSIVPFYPFFGEGSPTKIDYYRKTVYPYSNLSTGGPWKIQSLDSFGPSTRFGGKARSVVT